MLTSLSRPVDLVILFEYRYSLKQARPRLRFDPNLRVECEEMHEVWPWASSAHKTH